MATINESDSVGEEFWVFHFLSPGLQVYLLKVEFSEYSSSMVER